MVLEINLSCVAMERSIGMISFVPGEIGGLANHKYKDMMKEFSYGVDISPTPRKSNGYE